MNVSVTSIIEIKKFFNFALEIAEADVKTLE